MSNDDITQPRRDTPAWTPPGQEGDMFTPAASRPSNNPYPAYGAPLVMPTSGYATAAMVLGLATFVAGGFAGLFAVIFGHLGLREVNSGTRGGKGQAITGLVLGYISLALSALILLLLIFGAVGAAGTSA